MHGRYTVSRCVCLLSAANLCADSQPTRRKWSAKNLVLSQAPAFLPGICSSISSSSRMHVCKLGCCLLPHRSPVTHYPLTSYIDTAHLSCARRCLSLSKLQPMRQSLAVTDTFLISFFLPFAASFCLFCMPYKCVLQVAQTMTRYIDAFCCSGCLGAEQSAYIMAL